MKTFATVLAAAAVAYVAAECPNACSGHGTCGANDACTCFDNYMGGDCSQRVCPYGLSFVDTPLGDLNHDGLVDASTASTGRSNKPETELWTEAHAYTECSGKGSCNRDSGECVCYDGFTGSACQRTTCPSDCSGHGQCYTLREIAKGTNRNGEVRGRNYREQSVDYGVTAYEGVAASFDYNFWDADKNQACVCDPGFFGPDCSLRECPRGDDPLTMSDKHCGGAACTSSKYYYGIAHHGTAKEVTVHFEWTPLDSYNTVLRAVRTQKLVLKPGMTGDDYAEMVQATLHTMPNNEMAGVTVTCVANHNAGAVIECDEAADFAAPTDFTVVVLEVDFSRGPQGAVSLPVAKVWAVDGSNMDDAGSDWAVEDLVSIAAQDAAGFTQMAVASGVAAQGGNLAINDANIDVGTELEGPGLTTDTWANLAPAVAGNKENAPCSNRGLCDYSTGQCQCFAGYSREDCSVQAALAM